MKEASSAITAAESTDATSTMLGVVFIPDCSMSFASHEPARVFAARRSSAGSGPRFMLFRMVESSLVV